MNTDSLSQDSSTRLVDRKGDGLRRREIEGNNKTAREDRVKSRISVAQQDDMEYHSIHFGTPQRTEKEVARQSNGHRVNIDSTEDDEDWVWIP